MKYGRNWYNLISTIIRMSSETEDSHVNVSRTQSVESAVARRKEHVDATITEEVGQIQPDHLAEVCQHLPEAGGKRLRPTMLLLSAESLAEVNAEQINYRAVPTADGGTVDMLRAGASVEVLHTFTLIHDDIMDDDDLRRGVTAVHAEYNQSRAIVAGDTLFGKAFEILLDAGAPSERSVRALSELATTGRQICEGQSRDLAFESREEITPDEYMRMVTEKTATLYATAVSMPAMLLGHDDAVEPLAWYGRDVGRAFQIQDDLLDLTQSSEQLGKQRGSDLVEDKETLITVHARTQGVDVDGLVDADSVSALDEASVQAAVAELEAAGSIDYARQTARDLVTSGKGHLEVLPDNEARAQLAAIADYLVDRNF
jgi:geranylgeranyl diphosphate synthase type I